MGRMQIMYRIQQSKENRSIENRMYIMHKIQLSIENNKELNGDNKSCIIMREELKGNSCQYMMGKNDIQGIEHYCDRRRRQRKGRQSKGRQRKGKA